MIPNQMTVEMRKKQYPVGTRLVCWGMHDPQPIPNGTVGSVQCVDDAGQLQMHWDNGRSLALVPEADAFSVVKPYRFISPMKVSWQRCVGADYEELSMSEALSYLPEITAFMNAAFSEGVSIYPRGLAEYLEDCGSCTAHLDRVVYSIKVKPYIHEGKLVALITCEVTSGTLTDAEREFLKDFIGGQLADGWGEGFAQEEFKVSDGHIQIEFFVPGRDNTITEIPSGVFGAESAGETRGEIGKREAIRVVVGWIQEENGETSHAFKLEDAVADAYDISADREFLAKQLGVTVSEVGVTSLILPLPQSLVARIKAENTQKPDPSKGINGIESMIQSLRGMAKASSENNLIAAIMGYHMYDEDEEYPSRHGLDETHVARLSKLLSEISPSAEADPRFSSYDYADALLHTIYDIDPKKLIALGSDDFRKFAALMNEVAAEKRAVYEGSGFDDTTLLKLIEETGVKPDDQGPDEAEL